MGITIGLMEFMTALRIALFLQQLSDTSRKIRSTNINKETQLWVSELYGSYLFTSHGIEPRLSLLENNMHPTTLRCDN